MKEKMVYVYAFTSCRDSMVTSRVMDLIVQPRYDGVFQEPITMSFSVSQVKPFTSCVTIGAFIVTFFRLVLSYSIYRFLLFLCMKRLHSFLIHSEVITKPEKIHASFGTLTTR